MKRVVPTSALAEEMEKNFLIACPYFTDFPIKVVIFSIYPTTDYFSSVGNLTIDYTICIWRACFNRVKDSTFTLGMTVIPFFTSLSSNYLSIFPYIKIRFICRLLQ